MSSRLPGCGCGVAFRRMCRFKRRYAGCTGAFIHTAFINETWLNRFPQRRVRAIYAAAWTDIGRREERKRERGNEREGFCEEEFYVLLVMQMQIVTSYTRAACRPVCEECYAISIPLLTVEPTVPVVYANYVPRNFVKFSRETSIQYFQVSRIFSDAQIRVRMPKFVSPLRHDNRGFQLYSVNIQFCVIGIKILRELILFFVLLVDQIVVDFIESGGKWHCRINC